MVEQHPPSYSIIIPSIYPSKSPDCHFIMPNHIKSLSREMCHESSARWSMVNGDLCNFVTLAQPTGPYSYSSLIQVIHSVHPSSVNVMWHWLRSWPVFMLNATVYLLPLHGISTYLHWLSLQAPIHTHTYCNLYFLSIQSMSTYMTLAQLTGPYPYPTLMQLLRSV